MGSLRARLPNVWASLPERLKSIERASTESSACVQPQRSPACWSWRDDFQKRIDVRLPGAFFMHSLRVWSGAGLGVRIASACDWRHGVCPLGRARGNHEAQMVGERKGRARHRVRQGPPRLDYEPSRKMADFLPPEIVFVEPACFTLIFMKNDSCKTAGVFFICVADSFLLAESIAVIPFF